MQKIGEHVKKVHRVPQSTDTINNFIKGAIRTK